MRIWKVVLAATILCGAADIAAAYPASTRTALNLRQAPSTRARVVAVVPRAAAINIQACTENWCRVNFRNRTGYLGRVYLTTERAAAQPPRPVAQRRPAPAPTPRYEERDYSYDYDEDVDARNRTDGYAYDYDDNAYDEYGDNAYNDDSGNNANNDGNYDRYAYNDRFASSGNDTFASNAPFGQTACFAEDAEWLIGRPATGVNLNDAREDADASIVRVLAPSGFYTQEFRGDRLTIEVDDHNIVVDVHCG